MKRREFITLMGGFAAGGSFTANAHGQQYRLLNEVRAAARAPLSEAETVADLHFNTDELLAIALARSSPSDCFNI